MHDIGSADGPAATGYARGGRAATHPEQAAASRALLVDVFETRILPRLLLAHRSGKSPAPIGTASANRSREGAASELLRLILREDERAAFLHLDALRCGGFDDVALMLDVLAPVARRLGALWESDDCDFVQVTIGLRRLGAMLRSLSLDDVWAGDGSTLAQGGASTLLLLSAPGETHGLGADMAAELFRRDGWEVERGDDNCLPRLAQRRFTAVGFSLACERYAEALNGAIGHARAISLNPRLLVLAGGYAFQSNPKLIGRIDVDYAASDVQDARLISRTLLERREAQ